jgi:hypothetical protein
MKTTHERAVEAETKAARFLADANAAKEAGKNADRLYASAQRWLDKFNELTDRGDAERIARAPRD